MRVQNVVHIGPYPPPAGGVAVHVQRLAEALRATRNATVFDPYRASKAVEPYVIPCGPPGLAAVARLIQLSRGSRADLFHFHVSSMKRFALGGGLLFAGMPRTVPRVLTIHSGRFVEEFNSAGRVEKALIRHICRECRGIVAVNSDIAKLLEGFSFADTAVAVIPAFLPPNRPSQGVLTEWVSKLRAQDRRVLVMSGYGHRNYSYDVVLNALTSDVELQQRCHLIICLYGFYDLPYVEEIMRAVEKTSFVTVMKDRSSLEFAEILAASDVYIRATETDGDAVAIREAAFFRKKVVASNSAIRPKGALLFTTRDHASCATAIRQAIEKEGVGYIADIGEMGLQALLGFYERL